MFVDTMRDARYVSMGANGIFGTTARGLADAPQPRLSALVQQQIVEMSLDGLVSVVKVKHKSVGVLLTGAGERQPDRTLYRIAGEFATPGGCVLQAFLAMAPAAPTAAAAGRWSLCRSGFNSRSAACCRSMSWCRWRLQAWWPR